jgi:hypothetical protein
MSKKQNESIKTDDRLDESVNKIVDLVAKVHAGESKESNGLDHLVNVFSECIMIRSVIFYYLYQVNDHYNTTSSEYLAQFD